MAQADTLLPYTGNRVQHTVQHTVQGLLFPGKSFHISMTDRGHGLRHPGEALSTPCTSR